MSDNIREKKLQELSSQQPAEAVSEIESTPEKETAIEQETEQPETQVPEKKLAPSKFQPQKRKSIQQIPSFRDEMTVKIEKILSDGLNDTYQRLSPVAKQEFKLKGEQTALQIRELLKSAHVKAKNVLRLILDWLRMLPGVNRFFLEQEAKIKTDKIIALKKIE